LLSILFIYIIRVIKYLPLRPKKDSHPAVFFKNLNYRHIKTNNGIPVDQ
jgi:hypothetical protein